MSVVVDVSNSSGESKTLAAKLIKEWGLEEAIGEYSPWAIGAEGELFGEAPQVHLEDVTGIPFVSGVPGVEEYQHRARVRARDGDFFAAGTRPPEGYEQYCRDLGLGSPEFLFARGENAMAVASACYEQEEALKTLQRRASQTGAIVLHPYMSIQPVWELAKAISAGTSGVVKVLGPPPPVLWVANDKSYLSRVVEECLSSSWIVETRRGTRVFEIAAQLSEMVREHRWVGLKRTRCASAMGNQVFESASLRGKNPQELEKLVEHFLHRTEWCEGEEVLVVEWLETELSPSTQIWIPPKGAGAPRLDGVYEQILDGPERVFVGSRPSTLPEPVNQALGDASLQVCKVLQQMGYVGRCSFDFIVTGDVHGEFEARFTESNGRWGGTSTPMHLVDRLVQGERPAYIATDLYLPESLAGMTFLDLKERLGADLFDASTKQGRFVLYNVGPLQKNRKFDLVSIGESPEDARFGLDEILAKRLIQG